LSRYVRSYGTRARELLDGVRSSDDLGACLGSDLYEREVDFLIGTEWARSADDIVWRRTKLGLRLTPVEIDAVAAYVTARNAACDAAVTAPR
jgi:glycerol-3-phosphate dehydrogenase